MLLENPEYPRKANSVLSQRSVLLETNDSETQVCTKFHLQKDPSSQCLL